MFKASHDFYLDLCLNCDGIVAELGVGNGRIALDVAAAGKNMIGVDVSNRMLTLLRSKAKKLNIYDKIKLIKSDIRNFKLKEKAKLITIPFRTIGHLLTLDDRIKCLECVYENLTSDGMLVFDHYNFDESWARKHDRVPIFMINKKISEKEQLFIWDTYEYHFEQKYMNFYVTTERANLYGKVNYRNHVSMNFSWLQPNDIYEMLEKTRFVIKEFYGEFNGDKFCQQISKNQIIMAVKK